MRSRSLTTVVLLLAALVAGSLAAQSSPRDQQGRDLGGPAQDPDRSLSYDPFTYGNASDPEDFRAVLVTWARTMEQAYGMTPHASTLFAEASYEDLETWLTYLDDREEFFRVTGRIVARAREAAAGVGIAPPGDRGEAPPPMSPGLLGAFPPDYPPNFGDYQVVVVNGINAFGVGATNQDRCTNTEWDDFLAAWYIIFKTLSALDGACTVAGCDPIGIICAAVCAPLEIASAALEIAAVPVDLCDIHAGAVDSAEIEAAFENSKSTLSNQSHIHDDLGVHDANIDGDLVVHNANLAAHDLNIDSDLAAHDANIDGDLQMHDTDIKALLDGVQGTLDNEVELRRVHLQVVELVNRQSYMVATTEAGQPVDVDFLAIEAYDDRAGGFTALGGATVSPVGTGVYVVDLNLAPNGPDKVFRLQVRHDDVVDHFGQTVFHRNAMANLGMGQ